MIRHSFYQMRPKPNYMNYLGTGRRQTGPTPGNIYHVELLQKTNKRIPFRLFEKWENKHNRAKALYWRLHIKEDFWINYKDIL